MPDSAKSFPEIGKWLRGKIGAGMGIADRLDAVCRPGPAVHQLLLRTGCGPGNLGGRALDAQIFGGRRNRRAVVEIDLEELLGRFWRRISTGQCSVSEIRAFAVLPASRRSWRRRAGAPFGGGDLVLAEDPRPSTSMIGMPSRIG